MSVPAKSVPAKSVIDALSGPAKSVIDALQSVDEVDDIPMQVSDLLREVWYRGGPVLEGPQTPEAHTPYYTRLTFDPKTFKKIVRWTVRTARGMKAQAIAGSGHSGVPVAAAAAYSLGIPLIAVRQREEDGGNTHDSYLVNAIVSQNVRYVIVDDLVATGRTIQRILKHIGDELPLAKPIGLLLYDDGLTTTEGLRDVDLPPLPVRLMRDGG